VKTLNRYRFSLQWGVDSAEKIQAGDILEKLGNKKSEFIVLAVTEYLKTHPDIPSDGRKINIIIKPSVTREQIEAMVKAAIHEHMAGLVPVTLKTGAANTVDPPDESNIDIMIKNLDMFAI